jgi:hypothetical protein
MPSMETVTLGVSPGGRTTAIVIVRNNEIVDMQVRDLKGTECCRNIICTWLKTAIEKYQVQAISMKVVPSYQSTEVLTDLYSEIRQLACNTGIFLSTFEMENLRKLSVERPKNALTLFKHLSQKFPEVEVQYHKVHIHRNRKIFEALACALAH